MFSIDKLNVSVFSDTQGMATDAADFVAKIIGQATKQRGEARVIFATGNSQLTLLSELVNNTSVAWEKVTAFHLDEYVNLPDDHPASFRLYLQEKLFNKLSFKQVHLLNGNADDPQAECDRYAALLAEAPIDLACIGIGENGHLAFNDPPADFETSALAHVVTLDEACRMQQVGEGHFPNMAAVPEQALSLSIPAIMAAKTINCYVPDERKADAVHCTLKGEITPDCPASILRQHDDAYLYLDADSASKVDVK